MLTFIENPLELAFGIMQRTAHFVPSSAPQSLPAGILLAPDFDSFCAKRQREFIAGRLCSLAALRDFTAGDMPLEIAYGDDGLPLWPVGYTGSITHSRGLVRAAVISLTQGRSIGIDSEEIIQRPLSSAMGKKIVTTREAAYFSSLNFLSQEQFLSLVFSAKESVFKCLYPLCKTNFYFSAFELTHISHSGDFEGSLCTDLSSRLSKGFTLVGRYAFHGGFIHTAVWI